MQCRHKWLQGWRLAEACLVLISVALWLPGTGVAATPADVGMASAIRVQRVQLYASATTRARLTARGMDANESVRTWDLFLRKYRIPFQTVQTVEQLEKLQPGVLLLPSTQALSEREKQAIIDFRGKGGAVLSTWMTGVRNESGEWRGYDFMESALDVKVVGTNEGEKEDTFLILHGDNPVLHDLPAGLRVWLEYAQGWYPLRMLGGQTAANLMDWSRSASSGKASSTIVFDERRQSSGRLSRSVVLGYPEPLWRSADPKALEAIAHNALMWLLRQPDAFVSTWPHPYASALMVAVGAIDVMVDADLLFAKALEEAGLRATYYLLSDSAPKSAKILKQIQSKGHEVDHHGDRFEGFKDQAAVTQGKRLETMVAEMKEAGFNLPTSAGFRAPMDSYDATTERLLQERGVGHFLGFMGTGDARLPYFSQSAGVVNTARPMVFLPRTQSPPEDLIDAEPEVGMKTFLAELDLVDKMAGLSIVSVPGQSMLSKEQLAEFFDSLKARRGRVWVTTATQVADWWRERARVSARLESAAVGIQLKVTVTGSGPLGQPVSVWVNLPESGALLRLVTPGGIGKVPRITSVDNWRSAVVLEGMAPGEYVWGVYFDQPPVSAGR